LRNNNDLVILDCDYDTKNIICECDQDKNHIFNISYDLFNNRKEFNTIICTRCNKIGRNINGIEKKYYNFIKENYDGDIIKNDRKILKPYELDIYIPDLKIAFEFNGFKWHSDEKVGKNYHKMKTDKCNELGIQLFHVFQDDWIYKNDIVESMILNCLRKTKNRIYARKCIIKEVKFNEYKNFMNNNHIQGYSICKYIYGLYYNNEIVSLISFGFRKISGKKKFELIRYGTKLNTSVVGGFSKLLKYSIKYLNFDELITYANKSYSNGDLYEKNNFQYIGDTKPNYTYVLNNKRYHRFSFRKSELIKQGFDSEKIEIQIMNERNMVRIYDSGNKKYKL